MKIFYKGWKTVEKSNEVEVNLKGKETESIKLLKMHYERNERGRKHKRGVNCALQKLKLIKTREHDLY